MNNTNNENNNLYSEMINYTNSINNNIIKKAKNFLTTIENNKEVKDENKIKAMENVINYKIFEELNKINSEIKKVDYKLKNFIKNSIKNVINEFKKSGSLEDKTKIFRDLITTIEEKNKKYHNAYLRELQKTSKLKTMERQIDVKLSHQKKEGLFNIDSKQKVNKNKKIQSIKKEKNINTKQYNNYYKRQELKSFLEMMKKVNNFIENVQEKNNNNIIGK